MILKNKYLMQCLRAEIRDSESHDEELQSGRLLSDTSVQPQFLNRTSESPNQVSSLNENSEFVPVMEKAELNKN
ncbi:hypothetical protein TNCT_444401 [Trichonephila clavata]|uniref:Uncharacterized protein n=1 Tax=Trichonephila clavata TaxID=2740835 RepID=A0A8X6LYG0_TRICU|nr:hypothetical protein TNCT_444401 [Trichonephila clavata]